MTLVAATTVLLGACSDDPAPSTEDPPLAGDGDETAAPEQTDEQDPDEQDPGEQEPEATTTIEPPLDLAGTTWFPATFSDAPGDTGITNPLDDKAYFELVGAEMWWIGNDLGDEEGGIILYGEDSTVWADPA